MNVPSIAYAEKNGFENKSCDGVCHKKVLPFLSVVQATEGSYDIAIKDGETFSAKEGGFFIAPSHSLQTITHRVNKESGKMSARWVFIDMKTGCGLSLDDMYSFPVIVPESIKSELCAAFDELFAASSDFEEYAGYYRITAVLMKVASAKAVDDFEIKAMEYVGQHYKDKIRVADMAKHFCISESSLYKRFIKAFSLSPVEYINHHRIYEAELLLKNTDENIENIAQSVGINDVVYFHRLFRKICKTTPKNFRSE